MCRFGIALASLWLLAVAAGSAAELAPAETAKLLENLREHRARRPSFTADFTEQKISRLLAAPLTSEGTIAFQAPDKFRRELKGRNPSLTVSNGQQLWIYYPNFNEVEWYTLGQRSFFDDSLAALTAGFNFQKIAEFYRYQAFRESGNYRLLLMPKTSGLKRILRQLQVWVDNDFTIVKTEAALPRDDRVLTTFRNQRPTPLAASVFEFKPPADAHVSRPLK